MKTNPNDQVSGPNLIQQIVGESNESFKQRAKMICDIHMEQPGLTKRELFAAMAMQGLFYGLKMEAVPGPLVAVLAVEHADALIEQLNKEKPKSPDLPDFIVDNLKKHGAARLFDTEGKPE